MRKGKPSQFPVWPPKTLLGPWCCDPAGLLVTSVSLISRVSVSLDQGSPSVLSDPNPGLQRTEQTAGNIKAAGPVRSRRPPLPPLHSEPQRVALHCCSHHQLAQPGSDLGAGLAPRCARGPRCPPDTDAGSCGLSPCPHPSQRRVGPPLPTADPDGSYQQALRTQSRLAAPAPPVE